MVGNRISGRRTKGHDDATGGRRATQREGGGERVCGNLARGAFFWFRTCVRFSPSRLYRCNANESGHDVLFLRGFLFVGCGGCGEVRWCEIERRSSICFEAVRYGLRGGYMRLAIIGDCSQASIIRRRISRC